jgi:hypothetical protein
MRKALIAWTMFAAISFGIASAQQPAPALTEARLQSAIMANDMNHDGAISRAEWDGNRAMLFMLDDANENGRLSLCELQHPPIPGIQRSASDCPQPDTPSAQSDEPPGMAVIDSDGDGYVSRAEWDARSNAIFPQWDSNHDGVITDADVQAEQPQQ